MIIYKSEASVSGLADKIRQSSSVAYTVPLKPWSVDRNALKGIIQKSIAKEQEKVQDLYTTKAILASSNWNKNDDVFGKAQIWDARHTPVNKPTNINHNQDKVVGHIVSDWAIDKDGNILNDDILIDDLPDLFHICVGSVIYGPNLWEKEEKIQEVTELIEKIEANKKYVSMECLFSSFGYAIISPDGKYYTLPRNENTAFLTAHLRAYGGKGYYNEYKIGRLLENLRFSGKGYVDEPANEYSVIFDEDTVFDFVKATQENPFDKTYHLAASLKDTEKTSMSDNAELKEQNTKLETALAKMQTELAEAQKQLKEADVAQYKTKITDLESSAKAANEKVAELEKSLAESAGKVSDLEKQLDEANKSKAEVEAKLKAEESAKVKANRISLLVDGGIAKDKAEKKVEAFTNLNDEQFKLVADELIAAVKASTTKTTEETETASTDASVLENAETEDGAGSPPVVTEEVESTRAALTDWFSTSLGQKKQDS